MSPVSAPAAEALTALLAAYLDPDLRPAGRLVDVPPSVAAQALELLPLDLPAARLNLVQPPMSWLVAQAAALAGGRLVGSLTAGRGLVVIDGIQADAAAAHPLAVRVAEAWPATGELPGALDSATAEAWTSWEATTPIWAGLGTDLLSSPLSDDAAVVGLWWD
jgi:hypothetical protein